MNKTRISVERRKETSKVLKENQLKKYSTDLNVSVSWKTTRKLFTIKMSISSSISSWGNNKVMTNGNCIVQLQHLQIEQDDF